MCFVAILVKCLIKLLREYKCFSRVTKSNFLEIKNVVPTYTTTVKKMIYLKKMIKILVKH